MRDIFLMFFISSLVGETIITLHQKYTNFPIWKSCRVREQSGAWTVKINRFKYAAAENKPNLISEYSAWFWFLSAFGKLNVNLSHFAYQSTVSSFHLYLNSYIILVGANINLSSSLYPNYHEIFNSVTLRKSQEWANYLSLYTSIWR